MNQAGLSPVERGEGGASIFLSRSVTFSRSPTCTAVQESELAVGQRVFGPSSMAFARSTLASPILPSAPCQKPSPIQSMGDLTRLQAHQDVGVVEGRGPPFHLVAVVQGDLVPGAE